MNANDDETSDPSPANPFELLNKEPAEASSLRDSFLVGYFKSKHLTDDAANALAAEIWLRHWLYDGECSSIIEQTIASARAKNQAGFSEQFSTEFEGLLAPLRKNDDGKVIPDPQKLDDEREKRIWGLLVTRVLDFLEADGLMALIPQDTHTDDDGVTVPFRFFPSEQSGCQDKNGNDLTGCDWVEVLEELGNLGPFGDNQVLRVGAVFPSSTPPGGASIGLSVALAWARRQARELPLFSPLAVMATGKLTETDEKISAVDGTGGQADTDTQGGAKGQLAKRLGVKLYVAVDASTNFSAGNGMKVCSFTSSTQWKDALGQIVQAIREMKLLDSPRHLRRVMDEDGEATSAEKASTNELWARWRRMERVLETNYQNQCAVEVKLVEFHRRNIAYKLGFHTLAPGYCNLQVVENLHPRGKIPGRVRELKKLDEFLNQKAGILLATSPLGHGKSALVTAWRRQIEAARTHSIFYHYFNQVDERLQLTSVFYRRLLEHLYLEAEEQPINKEQPTENDVRIAWDRWRHSKLCKKPLLVVIDGLDEAQSCPFPLPAKLPDNVWILVTCRAGENTSLHPFAEVWKKHAEESEIQCTLFEVPPLDIPSLASWLASSLSDLDEHLKVDLPPIDVIAALVHSHSKGIALWVHWFLPDFRQAIVRRENWKAVVNQTPREVSSLILKQWKRLNDLCLNDSSEGAQSRLARKIVFFLIAGKGPLANSELTTLLELDPLDELANLSPEAQRWVAMRLADDKWGTRFSLNNSLIRQAIAPKGTAYREQVKINYAPKLLEYCRNKWKEGSPHALRHLPEYLVDLRNWSGLDDLLAGKDGKEFNKLQRRAFPDEPALALAVVRKSLELEAAANQKDPLALTELSLTHAALVHNHAKPIPWERAEKIPVLKLAEHMTRLPVQWDPAAEVMWHLLAAWLRQKQGDSAERNRHLIALGQSQVKVPAYWALLASALLPDCFNDAATPWLRELADRLLPPEALSDLVGRLARRGARGRGIAKRIADARLSSKPVSGQRLSWLERRTREEIILALAETGNGGEACDMVFANKGSTSEQNREEWLSVVIAQVNALAKYWKERAEPNALPWMARCQRELINIVKEANLQHGFFYRSCEVLGQLAAWRLGLLLKVEGITSETIDECERQARWQIRLIENEERRAVINKDRYVKHPAPISILCELSESFASGLARQGKIRAERWRQKSLACHEEAIRQWNDYRQNEGASSVEILQHWLWLGQTTLRLCESGIWAESESEMKRQELVRHIRSVLLDSSSTTREARATLLSKGSSAGDFPNETREIEPVEWDQVIVTAVEVIRDLEEISPRQLADVIRQACSERERARAISRCVQSWTDAEQVEHLLDCGRWSRTDCAAAWACWFRNQSKYNNFKSIEDLARYASRSILVGTAHVRGSDAFQRIELLAEIAVATPDQRANSLLSIASHISTSTAPSEMKFRMWLDLARIIDPHPDDNFAMLMWQNTFVEKSRAELNAQYFPLDSISQGATFARAAFLRGESSRSIEITLNKAVEDIALTTCRTDRIKGLCEVAEAAAECRQYEFADRLFNEAHQRIPKASTAPLGMKVKMVRPFMLAEWLSGLAKAVCCLPWDGEPQSRWAQEAFSRAILNEIRSETRAYQESLRAYAVSGVWLINFDKDYRDAGLFLMGDIQDLPLIVTKLASQRDSLSAYLYARFSQETRQIMANFQANNAPSGKTQRALLDEFNKIVTNPEFFESRCFKDVTLTRDANRLMKVHSHSHCEADLIRFNRRLLRDAYPLEIVENQKKTRACKAIDECLIEIGDPRTKARALRDIAVLEAYAGQTEKAFQRIQTLAEGFDKDDVLHRVATIFAKRVLQARRPNEAYVNMQTFTQVLPYSAEYFGATYLVLAKLVRLFPKYASEIRKTIDRRHLLDL